MSVVCQRCSFSYPVERVKDFESECQTFEVMVAEEATIYYRIFRALKCSIFQSSSQCNPCDTFFRSVSKGFYRNSLRRPALACMVNPTARAIFKLQKLYLDTQEDNNERIKNRKSRIKYQQNA